MRKGEISNHPAKQVMFRLEQIADEIKVTFFKKLKIEINDLYLISKLNTLFMQKDVQLVIGVVLLKRYQEQIEEYLDNADLLYKEVILAETEEEMEEIIKKEHLEVINPYSSELLWM